MFRPLNARCQRTRTCMAARWGCFI